MGFSGRRQKSGEKRTGYIGELMNQGGNSPRTSAGTLPEMLAQGGSTKRKNPGTKKLKEYMGQ